MVHNQYFGCSHRVRPGEGPGRSCTHRGAGPAPVPIQSQVSGEGVTVTLVEWRGDGERGRGQRPEVAGWWVSWSPR